MVDQIPYCVLAKIMRCGHFVTQPQSLVALGCPRTLYIPSPREHPGTNN